MIRFQQFQYVVKLIGLTLLMKMLISCEKKAEVSNGNRSRIDSILNGCISRRDGDQMLTAISYLDSSYRNFKEAGPVDLWEKYNFKANYYLYYEPEPDKASMAIDSMYTVIGGASGQYKELYARTVFSEGDLLMGQKNYTEAFDRYYAGRDYAQKHLDSCKYAQFSYSLGMVRYRQEQFEKALPYFKQYLLESATCRTGFNDQVLLPQSAINAIALCFEKTQLPDSAIAYYHRTLNFLEAKAPLFPGDQPYFQRARGVVSGNLGGVLALLKRTKEAENYLLESIAINNRPGYEMADALTAEIKLAGLYIRSGRLNESAGILDDIRRDIDRLAKVRRPTEQYRLRYYQLRAELSDQTGSAADALRAMKTYISLKDSVAKVTAGMSLADMETNFKLKDQQYQLSLLTKENQIRRQSTVMAVGFAILIVIILKVVWDNLRRSSRNLRELKRLNERIVDQNMVMQGTLSALEQSQSENSKVMQVVAHDLRNPVGGIYALTSMMLKDDRRSAEDREMLELIKTTSRDSLDMVADLLNTHSRPESLVKEPVDLQMMLRHCVELLRLRAEEKNQQLFLGAQPAIVMVNREKMWRVFSNLIANAIKFSGTATTITVRLKIGEGVVLIEVEDQGIGIPDDIKDKLFDMQLAAQRSGTAGEKSYGLGLAISRQIVESHGGKLWFQSQEGSGTTFFVELPVK